MRFCEGVCLRLLDDKTTTTELYYECTTCKKKYKADDKDTLRFEQTFHNTTRSGQGAFMRTAAFDVCNPKVYKDCPKCKNPIVTSVVGGDSMSFTYLCECGYRF